jgi:uncharacterized protein
MTEQISPVQARRIALAAQGFRLARPAGVDQGHLDQAVKRLGLHQIDSVNVLAPGPYLSAFSWLGLPSLRKRYWGQHLWARGYWAVASGNVTDDAWAEYIKSRVPARTGP